MTKAQVNALLKRAATEVPADCCEKFVKGGSHIAPEIYCKTCSYTRWEHDVKMLLGLVQDLQKKSVTVSLKLKKVL